MADTQIVEQVRATTRAYKSIERGIGAALALNATDASAIETIAHAGTITPSELASELSVTIAAVSFVLSRLETQGAIVREQNPVDRRSSLISLSPPTRAVAATHLARSTTSIAESFDALSPDEQSTVLEFLRVVEQSFTDTAREV